MFYLFTFIRLGQATITLLRMLIPALPLLSAPSLITVQTLAPKPLRMLLLDPLELFSEIFLDVKAASAAVTVIIWRLPEHLDLFHQLSDCDVLVGALVEPAPAG